MGHVPKVWNQHNQVVLEYTKLFINPTQKIVYCALMAGLSAILQSAGGFGGPGYVLSSFSSLPIILATILAFRNGLITYMATIGLLFILQPTELFIFPFITGLLGLALGFSFQYLHRFLAMVCLSGIALCSGIMILLYVFDFPVLGPGFSSAFQLQTVGLIFAFSLIYCWIWLKVSIFVVKMVIWVASKQK
jgi:hypothetical protein